MEGERLKPVKKKKEEDFVTPKLKMIEKINASSLKTWINEFYDSRNFKLLFDKNTCNDLTVNKLTQIAKNNDISFSKDANKQQKCDRIFEKIK